MINAIRALGLAALVAVVPGGQQQEPRPSTASDARTRDVYVSVLDSKDAPVTGLAAADFVVREDGAPREVLRAGPATAPMQIILLVDDSQALTPALQPMREGLTKFVEKMQGHGEIGIVTVGERATFGCREVCALRGGSDRRDHRRRVCGASAHRQTGR